MFKILSPVSGGTELQGAKTVKPLDQPFSQEREEINWACGDCIGQGAFGKVVLGLNVVTGTLMAVKQVIFLFLNGENEGASEEP